MLVHSHLKLLPCSPAYIGIFVAPGLLELYIVTTWLCIGGSSNKTLAAQQGHLKLLCQ